MEIIDVMKDADYDTDKILEAVTGLDKTENILRAFDKAGFSVGDLLKAGATGILGVSVGFFEDVF